MDNIEPKSSSGSHNSNITPDVTSMSTLELLQNPGALCAGIELLNNWCSDGVSGEELGNILGITDSNEGLSNENVIR